jgi:hypothetical protein
MTTTPLIPGADNGARFSTTFSRQPCEDSRPGEHSLKAELPTSLLIVLTILDTRIAREISIPPQTTAKRTGKTRANSTRATPRSEADLFENVQIKFVKGEFF